MTASASAPNSRAEAMDEASLVSTGRLPVPEQVRALMYVAHERIAGNDEGQNSDVYPALAAVIVGTATATQDRMRRSGAERAAAQQQQAAAPTDASAQAEMAQMQEQLTALQAQQAEEAALGEPGAMIAQLQQPAQLKESGMLNEEEFAAAKARLLAG